jgi:hypothetical protein
LGYFKVVKFGTLTNDAFVQGYESDGNESDTSVKTVKSNKSTSSSKSAKAAAASNLPLADSIVLESPLETTSPKVRYQSITMLKVVFRTNFNKFTNQ